MDETIRTNASDLRTLSPEDERLLVKYTDTVIAEKGAQLPPAVEGLPKILCDAPPVLVDNVYNLQPEQRLIVVTKTSMAAELARVLNRSFTERHIALYENGAWDAEPALEEIRLLNSMLTDADGRELRIVNNLIPGIYASADGRLLASTGYLTELGGMPLYGKQFHDAWGTLLPEDFTTETLADDSLDFVSRTLAAANLFVQMKKRDDNRVPIPEHTLIFKEGRCLVTEWQAPADRDAAIRRVFFLLLFGAEEHSDALASMLPVLAEAAHVPSSFLNDLENIYINGAPCSFRKWNNIFERLMLDYDEAGILKGGDEE